MIRVDVRRKTNSMSDTTVDQKHVSTSIVGAFFHICNVARRVVVGRLREVAEMRRRMRPHEPRVL